jgi:protein-S-isoprenylcysteine O-methyltransferase Ste14
MLTYPAIIGFIYLVLLHIIDGMSFGITALLLMPYTVIVSAIGFWAGLTYVERKEEKILKRQASVAKKEDNNA